MTAPEPELPPEGPPSGDPLDLVPLAGDSPEPAGGATEVQPVDPGIVAYPLDWTEYRRAREVCWRAVTGPLFLKLIPLAGWIGLVTAGVLVGVGVGADLAPFFLVFGVGYLGSGVLRRRGVRRDFRKLVRRVGSAESEVRVAWRDEGLRVEDGRETREIAWDEVRVVLVTCAGFLAEPRRSGGIWLPYSGFLDPDEADRFEEDARRRGVAIVDRRSVG